MKLVRYGAPGREQPGIIGEVRNSVLVSITFCNCIKIHIRYVNGRFEFLFA